MRVFKVAASIGICAALLAQPVFAQDSPTWNIIVENDSFIAGRDYHYTNGVQISWTSAPASRADGFTSFAENFMLPAHDSSKWRDGFFLGQSIFTPENLFLPIPASSDRPYAGFLFGGARLYRDSEDVLDRVEATIGIIGPAALGREAQSWWHSVGLAGGVKPAGWDHQLRTEPGLILRGQRIWRVALGDGPLEFELLPETNVALGNIYTHAGAGAVLRIGENLRADWGPARISPALQGADFQKPDALAWYIFAGMEGRAVARNVFLDGNSFTTSRSVDKEPLVGDFTAGAAILFPAFRLTGSFTHRTREFTAQREDDEFVALTISFPGLSSLHLCGPGDTHFPWPPVLKSKD